MDAPRFTVAVKDLDYGERTLDEEIPVEWLASAVEGTEATASNGAGHLTATVSKTGRQVMVRGRAEAVVTMPCARTLDPVRIPLTAELFLLLSPRAEASETRKGPRARSVDRGPRQPAKPEGKGPTRGKKGRNAPVEEPELAPDQAAEDTYDGERVVLDPFIREFLLLELPLVPLREDLRSQETPAIDVPPERPAPAESPAERAIDPRLMPLAALASRLKNEISKKE